MMNRCGLNEADAALLLEADLHELRGKGESALAMRIRNEPNMSRAAQHIIARLGAINTLISTTAEASPLATTGRTRPASSRHAVRVRRVMLVAGGLAAAALAGIILYRGSPRSAPIISSPPLTATLNASSTRPFAVLSTDNPDIAVVWLFSKEIK
ncbi:MAG: hypothetical protein ABIS27_02780 [Longimicrobiales bacterium]